MHSRKKPTWTGCEVPPIYRTRLRFIAGQYTARATSSPIKTGAEARLTAIVTPATRRTLLTFPAVLKINAPSHCTQQQKGYLYSQMTTI